MTTKKERKMELVSSGSGSIYWKPVKIGDSIEGIFDGCERVVGGKFGAIENNEKTGKKEKVQYPASIISEETGEITKMPTSKMIDEFFRGDDENLKPLKKGTFVKITFTGKKLKKDKKEGEDNSTYNTYLLEKEID